MSELFEVVYTELRSRAHAQLSGGAPQTLGATALVHETFLKLVAADNPDWNDRTHFFRVAARAMRQIAVDYARAKGAKRRGGGLTIMEFDDRRISSNDDPESLIALDEALSALGRRSQRLLSLVELRFFSGLSVDDAAKALAISPRTVKRDWRLARAFINDRLDRHPTRE